MKTDLWWAALSLDSWDWIKRRQPAEHSHAFIVLFWLIGCHVTSSFGLLLLWPLCCHGLPPGTAGPGNPFSLSCFWQGILSLLQKRKRRQLFCPFPASLTRCLQQQPSRTALQLIKKPSGSLPQSSRHRPSTVFLYVAAPTSSSAVSILTPLVFYLLRMALGLSSRSSKALHA